MPYIYIGGIFVLITSAWGCPSGVASLVPLGGHLTALIECLTVLLEYIDLISVDVTYSTQSWTGTCPPRSAFGYTTRVPPDPASKNHYSA